MMKRKTLKINTELFSHANISLKHLSQSIKPHLLCANVTTYRIPVIEHWDSLFINNEDMREFRGTYVRLTPHPQRKMNTLFN